MLTSKQRAFLLSLANTLEPMVMVGKFGHTEQVDKALDAELTRRELLKLKFQDHKDRKREMAEALASNAGAELVRIIGNVAIFWRQSADPEKRAITLPAE